MPADLPGNNYNAPVGNEDMAFEQRIYRDEFLARMRLLFGHPTYLTVAAWGIVSEADPTTQDSTQSFGPLEVTAGSSDLTVSIAPGIVVTKSGHWVEISTGLVSVQLASTDDAAQNVVAVKFFTSDPDEKIPNEFGTPSYKRRLVPSDEDKVVVYTMSQWNALTSDSQDDHVPIAVATIVTDATAAKSVSVTHSNSSFTWLRPWFSPVDIEHRQMVGSGTVSETNPHGTSFNELSIGNFTLPQLISNVGQVIAKETSLARIPGEICTADVPSGLIKTDDGSGTLTGVANAQYIDLGFYPIALGSVYTDGDEDAQWVFQILPGTTIIYQPGVGETAVPGSTDLQVRAVKVTTLEPPGAVQSSSVTAFNVGAIQSTQAVVASGNVYTSDQSVTLQNTLSTIGSIPAQYRAYFADGKVVLNPQVIVCNTLLTDITASGISPSITQLTTGRVLVALDKAAAGASLSVKVKITGEDADGNAQEEVLTFGSSWSQAPSPGTSTHVNAFQRGSLTFSTIDTISLDENLNSGGTAEICVWVVLDEVNSDLSYAASIAEFFWDGSKISACEDTRIIHYNMQYQHDLDSSLAQSLVQHLSQAISGTAINYYLEDFRRPQLGSLIAPDPDNWDSILGIGGALKPDLVWDASQVLAPGLNGFYESRALPMAHVSLVSEGVFFTIFPSYRSERHRDIVFLLSVQFQVAATGVWGGWTNYSVLIPRGFTTLPTKVEVVAPTGTGAFRFRTGAKDIIAVGMSHFIP